MNFHRKFIIKCKLPAVVCRNPGAITNLMLPKYKIVPSRKIAGAVLTLNKFAYLFYTGLCCIFFFIKYSRFKTCYVFCQGFHKVPFLDCPKMNCKSTNTSQCCQTQSINKAINHSVDCFVGPNTCINQDLFFKSYFRWCSQFV